MTDEKRKCEHPVCGWTMLRRLWIGAEKEERQKELIEWQQKRMQELGISDLSEEQKRLLREFKKKQEP